MSDRSVEEVEVAGLRIAYRRAGDGPPVLFLHGAFADGRAWRRQLDELSDEFAVVAWDAPGCGRSDDPPETVGEREYAEYLAAFVRALGLERPAIVGHSLGGVMALALERHRPGLAGGLVLVSTYAGWAGSLPPEVVDARLEQARRDVDLPYDVLVERYVPEFFTESTPPALLEEAAAMMRDSHPAGMRALLHAFGRADLREVLPRIAVSTLLVWGELDRRSPPAVGRQFAAAIPGAELVVLADAGHEGPTEAAPAFNRAVRRFLRSLGGASVDAP